MKNLLKPTLGMLLCITLLSCVKDVDFDEAENITLTPVVELDLIYFNVDANEFFDESTNNARLTLSDTTEIRFLDDTEVQESLLRADFLFKFTNSIPRTFDVNFEFISEQGELTYEYATVVEDGTPQTPIVSLNEVSVQGEEILDLTGANRVVVNVTIPAADASLEGELKLQSKTTYYLEIKERD